MVTPTTRGLAAHAPAPDLAALAADLRAIYTEAYEPSHRAAAQAQTRFETADGTSIVDPVYAADAAGCRAVNAQLAATVDRHLPGATAIVRVDEPAVIDSQWLYHQRVVVIEWDYTLDFGDPQALVVWEVTQ